MSVFTSSKMSSAKTATLLSLLVFTISFLNLVQPTPLVCPPGP
ncbi:unnamed protein product, partial [Allacma fusca]